MSAIHERSSVSHGSASRSSTPGRVGRGAEGRSARGTNSFLIGRLRRFVVEAIPVLGYTWGALSVVFRGVKATMEANVPGADCVSQDSCVHLSVARNCALTQSWKAQTGCLLIGLIGLSWCVVLAVFISDFVTPSFVDKADESLDLALCFHLNILYKEPLVYKGKYLTVFMCFLTLCFGLVVATDPVVMFQAVFIPFGISVVSALGIFPTTDECAFRYTQYQSAFLLDGNNANDNEFGKLFKRCHTRVYEAIGKQAFKDFEARDKQR